MFTEDTERSVISLTGINHKVASIALRERLSIPPQEYYSVLTTLKKQGVVDEAVVLSTCNRTEVIATSADGPTLRAEIEALFESRSGVRRSEFSSSLYFLERGEAIQHVFRVASGLDSMVIGEPQILGQLKHAFEFAYGAGSTSALLNRLFQRAFGVAKAVRTRTNIGRLAVSVCYASKVLAEQIFGDLRETRVMVLGAGDTGALAAKHFYSAGVRRFFVVNKTLSKAAELAEMVGGVAVDLSHFHDYLPEADIILGALSLPSTNASILTKDDVARSLRARSGESQFFIDLGVPRNFAADIDTLSDVFLYTIDDLQAVVQRNLDARSLETKHAELIVEEEVRKFTQWLEFRNVEPAIRRLRERCEAYSQEEVRKTVLRLRKLGIAESPEVAQALDDLADSLLAKVLHQPLTTLRKQLHEAKGNADSFEEYFAPPRQKQR